MKLLPLGTVIEINNCKACVIGYTSVEKESTMICGYFVVPYPVGFANIDKVVFVPRDSEIDVLAQGYMTIPSERAIDAIAESLNIVSGVSQDKLMNFNQMLKESDLSKREALEK